MQNLRRNNKFHEPLGEQQEWLLFCYDMLQKQWMSNFDILKAAWAPFLFHINDSIFTKFKARKLTLSSSPSPVAPVISCNSSVFINFFVFFLIHAQRKLLWQVSSEIANNFNWPSGQRTGCLVSRDLFGVGRVEQRLKWQNG